MIAGYRVLLQDGQGREVQEAEFWVARYSTAGPLTPLDQAKEAARSKVCALAVHSRGSKVRMVGIEEKANAQ